MRLLRLLPLLALSLVPLHAQVIGPTQFVTQDPSGLCSAAPYQLTVNINSGKMMACVAGSYQQVGGGSGSGATIAGTANKITATGAACTAGVAGTCTLTLPSGVVLVGPLLGTPASGVLTNATGLPLATGVTGTLPFENGGTGQTSYTDGQLLIGNTATGGLSKATITAGANVTITNGNGTITIGASGGSGSGCLTAGVAGQLLIDDGAGGCTSAAAATYATGVETLGTAGSVVGGVDLKNATSGTISIRPVTGALGSVTLTLPALTGTIVAATTSTTASQPLFATTTAGAPAYRGIAASDLPATLTSGTAITNAALTTPTLGTPASGTLTNTTGLPLTTGVTGTLPVANGGSGLATLTAHALYAGNGTSAPTAIGPDASTAKALFSGGASADPAFRVIAAADLPATLTSGTAITNAALTTPAIGAATGTSLSLGTDNSVAGTVTLANGSAAAHTIWSSGATTTNTIAGFTAVPTTGRLLDCSVSSTTCTLHDSGLTTANVVNASSPGAGVAHFAGSTQTVTSSLIVNADITNTTIDLTAKVTGILPTANGGTANAFFTVSGPATSAKTFTFPNASAAVLTDNALVTAAQGGTANGFFAVSGPATSTKTFTFPNASATVLTTNAAVTAGQGGTGVANTATLTLGSSNQNWATLGTGIVKNTTTTGALTNAASADIYGLFSGSCSSSTFLRGDGACATPSGSISGLTTNGIVAGASSTTIATPSATSTLDSSGNMVLAGTLTTTGIVTGSGPSLTVGTGGADAYGEGTVPSVGAAAGVDVVYADSTQHGLLASFNNGSYLPLVQGPASSTANHVPTFNATNGGLLKDSGLTLTASTGTITLTNAKTFSVSNTLTLAGTDSTTITFPATTGTMLGATATSTTTTQVLHASATAGYGTFSAIAAGDLPSTLTSGTAITNAALTTPTLGTPASGTMTNVTGTATGLTSGITNALKSATTTVDVSAATAPSTGQALIATDSTHATWQTPAGGGNVSTTGSPANHQVALFASSTTIGGLAVPASGTLFQGVSAADPSWTATPTVGVAGTTAGTIAYAGVTAGTFTIGATPNTTASNTMLGPAAVITTGHVIDCTTSSTTCTLHDSGIVTADVVTAASNYSSGAFVIAAGANKTTSGATVPGTGVLTFLATPSGANFNSMIASGGIPINCSGTCSKTANYTTLLGDGGGMIIHAASDNNARTFTIDSNANVAYPLYTVLTFVNGINTLTIAITSDTMTLAGTATTGSRTLAANGVATAVKIGTTSWLISGPGLT